MNELKEKTCMRNLLTLAACGVLALGVAACGDDDNSSSDSSSSGGNLSGSVSIDGSSTVAPFAQAASEGFSGENPDVKVTVGTSGTGGGFEKFCNGETDISDASRPIKPDEEAPICKKNGIKYSEVQVANDGIAVVTNKSLKVDCCGTRARRSRASTRSIRSSRARSSSCSARTPTRERSTSSPAL
jgi:phosphate transport system substrate-binding protein